jgi:hypothetical protein
VINTTQTEYSAVISEQVINLNIVNTSNIKQSKTERCVRVINTPALCSRGLRLKPWPLRQAILIEVFCGFPQFLQENSGIVP